MTRRSPLVWIALLALFAGMLTAAAQQPPAELRNEEESERALVQLRGSRGFANAPPTDRAIAEMLLDVKSGKLPAREFYQKLGSLNAGMPEVRQVRTRIEAAGLSEAFFGARFAEGGTPVEKTILTYRRDATSAAIKDALQSTEHSSTVFVGKVGGWASANPNSLTIDGDIDFTFISADTRVELKLKQAFDASLQERLNLSATNNSADVVATAQGRATLDVYLGSAGQDYGQRNLKEIQKAAPDGTLAGSDADDLKETVERQRVTLAADVRLPTVKNVGDPGLSMELGRHFVHDIQGSSEFGPTGAIIKSAKYLHRSLQASGGAGGNPALAALAAQITALKDARNVAELDALLRRNFGPGKISPDQVAAFEARVAGAIWHNVAVSISRQLSDFKTRQTRAEALEGPARDRALADIKGDFARLYDTIQAEVLALKGQNVSYPGSVNQQIALVNELKATLEKLGHAISEQDLKERRYVEGLLRANTLATRKMALAQVMLKVNQGVDRANAFLDLIDTKLMSDLRGEGDFDDLANEIKSTATELASGDQTIREGARAKALAIGSRAKGVIQQANREMNALVQGSSTGRKTTRGLMIIGLAEESAAYVQAFSQHEGMDAVAAVATEFFRRRVPFGSSIERVMMGDYIGAGWDAVTTVFPPLALPQAAVGIAQSLAETGTELYWQEQLGLFADGLYEKSVFKPVAATQVGTGVIAEWRLQSFSYRNRTYAHFQEFLKQRRDQIKAMAAELRKPLRSRDLLGPLYSYDTGVIDDFAADGILRRNLMSADPFLQFLDELSAKPEVGPKLEQHFKDQKRVRWEEVKLAYLFEIVDRLESRWAQEWALNSGQMPAMLQELDRITRELEINEAVWISLEQQAAVPNWKVMIAWFGQLKRNYFAEPAAVTFAQEAAGLVLRYLDAYRNILETRGLIEGQLGLDGVREGGLRLMTGLSVFTANPEDDIKEADTWVRSLENLRLRTTDELRAIKARLTDEPLAQTRLDGGFDQDSQRQLWQVDMWRNMWSRYIHRPDARSPVRDAEDAETVKKRLEARRQATLDAFAEHYRSLGALGVTVVDQATGKPIPGVRVVLRGAASASDRTDADGKASISGLRRGRYDVHFEVRGYKATTRDVEFTGDGGARNRIAIRVPLAPDAPPPPPPPAGSLTAKVLDAVTKKPIGGAVVFLEGSGGQRSEVAGADGVSRFAGIADGSYDLRAAMAGYVSSGKAGVTLPNPVTGARARSAVIRLKPEPPKIVLSNVAVRVTDEATGKPVAGAIVAIENAGPGKKVDGEGRVSYAELPPGSYTVRVTAPNLPPTSRAFTLPAPLRIGEETPTLRLAIALKAERLSTLAITVHERGAGKAVPGADVMVQGPAGRYSRKAGPDGVVRLEGLPAGTYAVHAISLGFEPSWVRDIVLPVGTEGPSSRSVSVSILRVIVMPPVDPKAGTQKTSTLQTQTQTPVMTENGDPEAAVCNAYSRLIHGKQGVSIMGFGKTANVRITGVRLVRQTIGTGTKGYCVKDMHNNNKEVCYPDKPPRVVERCAFDYEADQLVNGKWVHVQHQSGQWDVEAALKDLEKHDPRTGQELRKRVNAGQPQVQPQPPSNTRPATSGGIDCTAYKGKTRDQVPLADIAKWLHCNRIAPVELSPDQKRLMQQFRRPQ